MGSLPGGEFRACFWREVSARSQEIFCEPVAVWMVFENGQVVGMIAGPAGTLVDAETLDNFLATRARARTSPATGKRLAGEPRNSVNEIRKGWLLSMVDFLTALARTPEEGNVRSKHREARTDLAALGKRDFAAYVERGQGEEFFSQAERLMAAFLSSIESAIYDQADQVGTVEERIARNTDQFAAALQVVVDTVFAGENPAGASLAVEKGRSGVRSTMTMSKRADVVGEATRIAQEKVSKGEAGSMVVGRAQVWRERPDLAQRYVELPVEEHGTPASPALRGAPVLKGGGVVEL